MKVLLDMMPANRTCQSDLEGAPYYQRELVIERNSALDKWVSGSFAKICVYVNSEEELLALYNKAKEQNILSALITDEGRTEFNGVQTNTVVAIGPDYSSVIDEITGHLQLL